MIQSRINFVSNKNVYNLIEIFLFNLIEIILYNLIEINNDSIEDMYLKQTF